jgi:phospholipid/cholesterol/gamma-HCH transport system substrate-binding protein
MRLSSRSRNIISGLCALVLMAAATTVGIKYSFGYFDPGYELTASFDTAGQGLIQDSDVKMRGLNVGHVQSIDLVDGRAEIVMFIDDGVDVPESTVAIIRPKTLFGEKFVDLVPGTDGTEVAGAVYGDGDTIDACDPEDLAAALGAETEQAQGCTVGPVELERVLAELYPILQAVDPQDLTTILDELATGAEGTAEAVNRSLVNGAALLEVQARHNDDTAEFLQDLADLTGELATRAPDLLAGAEDLNVALPVLTRNSQSFTALLGQLERLATDGAELLEGNTAFIDAVYTDGQRTLDTLFADRAQLIPLVTGLGSYLDILGSLGHIPVGDGSFMAAVKGILGGQSCALPVCPTQSTAATAAPEQPPVPPILAPGPSLPSVDEALDSSTDDLVDLLTGIFGGPR